MICFGGCRQESIHCADGVAGSLASRTLARPSFETAFDAPVFIAAMLAFILALMVFLREIFLAVSSARSQMR